MRRPEDWSHSTWSGHLLQPSHRLDVPYRVLAAQRQHADRWLAACTPSTCITRHSRASRPASMLGNKHCCETASNLESADQQPGIYHICQLSAFLAGSFPPPPRPGLLRASFWSWMAHRVCHSRLPVHPVACGLLLYAARPAELESARCLVGRMPLSNTSKLAESGERSFRATCIIMLTRPPPTAHRPIQSTRQGRDTWYMYSGPSRSIKVSMYGQPLRLARLSAKHK